jgi:osmotically-inducible protein OsmY
MQLSADPAEIAAVSKSLAADRKLTMRVQGARAKDKEVQALGLAVNTMDGYVGLSGIAPFHAQAVRTVAIARATLGVKGVIDEIAVH